MSGPPRVRVRVRVTGLVQGVFYRQSTALEAARLGLSGAVRNLSDGSVELEAEGERSAVEALVAWCRRGRRRRGWKDSTWRGSRPPGA